MSTTPRSTSKKVHIFEPWHTSQTPLHGAQLSPPFTRLPAYPPKTDTCALLQQFLEHCDGFSIGSNDLTQLTLGIDRDASAEVLTKNFSERHPAVLALMDMAIQACHVAGKPVGICGQGPADDAALLRWLVHHRVSSVSVVPDAFLSTRTRVIEAEAEAEAVTSSKNPFLPQAASLPMASVKYPFIK